jgi:hypothetical protein
MVPAIGLQTGYIQPADQGHVNHCVDRTESDIFLQRIKHKSVL